MESLAVLLGVVAAIVVPGLVFLWWARRLEGGRCASCRGEWVELPVGVST